jgi:hypothetical protein
MLSLFLARILAWVSQQLYRAVLSRCAAHPLVRLAQLYDLAPVVAACQAYQHAPGTKGSPPTYSINQLVRDEFVRAWADSCSDPELELLLASNLLVRWFVELPLLGPTPDHSTLSRFHAWVTVHQPDALFRNVLTFLDQIDPADPACTPQIVDTFAMASPAAASPALTICCDISSVAWLPSGSPRLPPPARPPSHRSISARSIASPSRIRLSRASSCSSSPSRLPPGLVQGVTRI